VNSAKDTLRERIRGSIAAQVDEAERLLNELKDADVETKLSMLISGWGRGLAAALEELAIAVDELPQWDAARAEAAATVPTPEQEAPQTRMEPQEKHSAQNHPAEDEEHLAERAKRSREQTAELQWETREARRELEESVAPREIDS
jgi:hypothetical protein